MFNVKNFLKREYNKNWKNYLRENNLSESSLDIIDISKFNDTNHWSRVVEWQGEKIEMSVCEYIAFMRRTANLNAKTFERNLDGKDKNIQYPWRDHELLGVQGEVAFMVWAKKNGLEIDDSGLKDFEPRSASKGEDDDGDFLIFHNDKTYSIDVKATMNLRGAMNCYTSSGSNKVPNKAQIFGHFKFIDGDRFLLTGFAWSREVLIDANFNHKAHYPCFAVDCKDLKKYNDLWKL